MIRIGVLISGSGSNLQAILDACAAGRIDGQVVVVLTDKANAYGLVRASCAGVAAIFVDPAAYATKQAYNEALRDLLVAHQVDLLCLAGYLRIVREPLLTAFAGRIMNVHPSLLPAFKGLDAQQQALDYGVRVSGCTVHFVWPGLDDGPIILQAAVPVFGKDTIATLRERILEQEHRIYPEAIQLFAKGRLQVEGRRVIVKR
ncbi:MAG TPA: phosphoribosylglycinamide formyltransferase [Symbiobacteriaceae bacterium]|nr:phosphoribosylglycinamide formyltransferase [Symbiobacteriaceae bacterium]